MRKYIGEFGLLFITVIWGMGFPMTKIALEGTNPYQLMTIRYFIATVILGIYLNRKLLKIDKKTIIYGCVLGAFGCIGFLLQSTGLLYTESSKSAFLTGVNVVIVPFIGFFIYKRKLDVNGLKGAVIAVFGVAVLSLNAELSVNIGDLLTIGCAFCFAFHVFYTKEFLDRGADPYLLTVLQMAVAFIICCATLPFTGGLHLSAIGRNSWLAIMYLTLFSTILCSILQALCQKLVSETKAAVILSSESIFGALFSVLLLNELFTIRMLIGSVFIFIGILITEIKPKAKEEL